MFNHIKTDPELCIGCKTCMAACVASHTGKALFALKPDSFDFTPRVHVVYTSKITKAVQCQQCPKPRCLDACPFHCISLGETIRSSLTKMPAGAAANAPAPAPLMPSP